MALKICISVRDQDFARTKSIGVFNVAMGLVRGLASRPDVELLVLANRTLRERLAPLLDGGRVRVWGVDDAPPRGAGRVAWDQQGVVAAVDESDCDWLLLPKGFPPFALRPARARVSVYVHDAIHTFYQERGWALSGGLEDRYFRLAFAAAVRRPDLVVTNSEFTARAVRSAGREGPVEPVGIGFDPLARRSAPTARVGRLLLVVSPHRYKLSAQAIAWVERWKAERGDASLVLGVGALPPGVPWRAGPEWQRVDRLDADAFAALRRGVDALIYMSAYEGFGMPPVEALLDGTRAVASDLPAHRENLPADVLFDNADYASFAAALDRCLGAAPPAPPQHSTWAEVAGRVVRAMGEVDAGVGAPTGPAGRVRRGAGAALRYARTRVPRQVRLGRAQIELPAFHMLDYYRWKAPAYDAAIEVLADLLWERYPGFAAIDVGANVGDTAALLCARHDVRVLCVEGSNRFVPLLRRNAAVIGGHVAVEPRYLGVDGKDLAAWERSGRGTSSIASALDAPGASVDPLGELLARWPAFRPPRLVKSDTDGMDFRILRSSMPTLAEYGPAVYFEYDPSFRRDGATEGIATIEDLAGAGYTTFVVWDNFGHPLTTIDERPVRRFEELNAYLAANRRHGRAVHYVDVCAFQARDADLARGLLDRLRTGPKPG